MFRHEKQKYVAYDMMNVSSCFQVVKMMIVVVVIFAVCWLPFHVYFIVTSYLPEITNEPYIQELFLAIYWLAMSNSMYNPIIYCWMNSRLVPATVITIFYEQIS